MKHQRIEDIGAQAAFTLVDAPTLSRRERLERWAELLARDPHRRLRALRLVEYLSESDRGLLRGHNTPMAVAYADPVFRAAGLRGDTFDDAREFFDLSEHEAHHLLCDCHYLGRMDGETVANRLHAAAHPAPAHRTFVDYLRAVRRWF